MIRIFLRRSALVARISTAGGFKPRSATTMVRLNPDSLPLLALGVTVVGLFPLSQALLKSCVCEPHFAAPPALTIAPRILATSSSLPKGYTHDDLASWGDRIMAHIWDAFHLLKKWSIFVMLPTVACFHYVSPELSMTLCTIGSTVIFYLTWYEICTDNSETMVGQSVGMKRAGTCMVKGDGSQVSVKTLFLRSLASWFGICDILVGFMNPDRQCLHDMFTNTYVMKAAAVKRVTST